ncbi:MAG: DUF3581 family protein [Candidatus Thiodiazotropha sp. 6PLUC4]
MKLANFYTTEDNRVSFSRHQASHFAKDIANDFNPIHDADAKMFCVPGDLLFAVAVDHFGLSQKMCFHFFGMVTDQKLIFSDSGDSKIDIIDDEGKKFLGIQRDGEISRDASLISNLTQGYVAFSGKTFPHLLVPLMAQQNVMINPGRPLVMYQSMEFTLDHLDEMHEPILESTNSSLEVQGKKAIAKLDFHIVEQGQEVGHGTKYMALRGLQTYQEEGMQRVVDSYNSYKEAYS